MAQKHSQYRSQQSISLKTELSENGFPRKKDLVIENLQSRNKRLKTQLNRVQTFLIEPEKSEQYMSAGFINKIDPADHQKALKKQLDNAYKKIHFMEQEVKKIQHQHLNANTSKKIQDSHQKLKQAEVISDRLKVQLSDMKKVIQRQDRALNNSHTVENNSKQINNLLREIQYFRIKIKDYEMSEINFEKYKKKQMNYIKKLQTQLMRQGFMKQSILNIRKKIIGKRAQSIKTQSSSFSHAYQTEKVIKSRRELKNTSFHKMVVEKNQEQSSFIPEQIRTQKMFDKMKGQIILLQKVSRDSERIIHNDEKEIKKIMQKNRKTGNQSHQIQKQIQTTENEIEKIRQLLTKQHLKPTLLPPRPPSVTKPRPKKPRISEVRGLKKEKTKTQKNLKLNKIEEYSMLISARLKYDEAGLATSKGTKFTDRQILGHEEQKTMITGIIGYLNKKYGIISGLQFIYNNSIDSEVHISEIERMMKLDEEKFICIIGQYIKGINGSFNSQKQLQSLTLQTSNSRYYRLGRNQKNSEQFFFEIEENQFPTCVFGSMVKGDSFDWFESLGVEISKQQKEKNPPTEHGLLSNQFDKFQY